MYGGLNCAIDQKGHRIFIKNHITGCSCMNKLLTDQLMSKMKYRI